MDLTRLAVDAGQFINRAVQYTEETLGQADKTDFDPALEELLARADLTKTWTDQIISQTEVLLQPSPGARLEERLYEQLEWSARPRPRANELLGDEMIQAGLELGSNTPYGTALVRCGEAQKHLSEAERKFVQSAQIHFLNPLRGFTEGEYRVIQNERKMLVNKRLDLDIAKSRVRKAHEADREARNLNANPFDDDYISHVSYMFSFLRVKWLKIWAQEISQAEMELRICQSLFDRQSEMTKRMLEGLHNTHTNHMRSLSDFVDAQAGYFAQCNQHAQELQKQLASIPAVFCSNNWQSAINNTANQQPSVSNHLANEPIGLDQVTPLPVLVHQIPAFDQDSWSLNSPPEAQAACVNSSLTTLPPVGTNKNNNNNTFSTDRQEGKQPFRLPVINGHAEQASSRSDTAKVSVERGVDDPMTADSQPSVESQATVTESLTANDPVTDPQASTEAVKQPDTNEEDVQAAPTQAEEVPTESSLTTLPPVGGNENNNNNTSPSADSQERGHQSAADNQSSTNRAFDHMRTSTEVEQAASSTSVSNGADSVPSPSNAASGESQTISDSMAANVTVTNPQVASETVNQPRMNGEDVQESSSDHQGVAE